MKNVLQTRQKERTRWAALHSKCSQSVVELPVAMTTSERSENEKAEKIVKFRQRGRLPTEAVRGSFLNFLPQLTPWMSHIDILSLTVWAGWPAVRARLFCHRLENSLVHRKHVHSCSPFGQSAATHAVLCSGSEMDKYVYSVRWPWKRFLIYLFFCWICEWTDKAGCYEAF